MVKYIENIRDRFINADFLGEGSYGEVYRTLDKITDQVVAIKSSIHTNEFIRELTVYSMIDHPNIIPLIGWGYDSDKWYLVFPLGIDLRVAFREKLLTLGQAIHDILSAVNFLHINGIFHGDIKDNNMIFLNNRIVLVDFGSVRYATWYNDKFIVKGTQSTPYYMDPEYVVNDWNPIECELYNTAVSLWRVRAMSRQQELYFPPVYKVVTSDIQFNSILNQLTKYPYTEREPIHVWYPSVTRGRVIEPPTDTPCPERYNALAVKCTQDMDNPYTARSVFQGLEIARKILIKYPRADLQSMHVFNLIRMCEILYGNDNYDLSRKENILTMLKATDGLLKPHTMWDDSVTFEDLKHWYPYLLDCNLIRQPRYVLEGATKNVFFYTLLDPNHVLKPIDITVTGATLPQIVSRIKYRLEHIKNESEFELLCGLALHYRKYLPELDMEMAKNLFNTLNDTKWDDRGEVILKMIYPNPLTTPNGFRVKITGHRQPFQ